jgi:hypothetical protein
MKQLTLQEHYNLIKEGKGHKDMFLKAAKSQFPNIVPNAATFEQTSTLLKQRSIISEAIWGVATGKTTQPDWFSIFNENVNENYVASSQEEPVKNSDKKISKEVEEDQESNFDYKDPKNRDNVYGQEFLTGYYTEMKDPKNSDKTVDELLELVSKNLAKDRLYYVKDGQFGVKGLGYTEDAPGLGAGKEAKGKYKSSGYGDLKENKETKSKNFEVGDEVKYNGKDYKITRIIDDRIYIKDLKYGKRPDSWVKAIDLKKLVKENMPQDELYQKRIDERNYLIRLIKTGTNEEIVDGLKTHIDYAKHTAILVMLQKYKLYKDVVSIIDMMGDDAQYILRGNKIYEFQVNTYDFKGTGLIVVGSTKIDNNAISDMVDKTGYYAIWNAQEGYWFFPEAEETLDALEMELDKEFGKRGINARFESQVEESLNENNMIKLMDLFEGEYYEMPKKEKKVKEIVKKKVKKSAIADRVKEIEAESMFNAMEGKIQAMAEEIEMRENKLSMIDENEDLQEFINPVRIKEMQKEIDELKKTKEKMEKEYEKKSKGRKPKEVIDETETEEGY